jgi:hypothetical protein
MDRPPIGIVRAVRWVRKGLQTPAPFTGVPTWLDLLIYVAGTVVLFLVGFASNFYWGAMAATSSYIVWFVWRVKKP